MYTGNYSSNNNFQPDLSNYPGNVLITNQETGIHLGSKQRYDFGNVEIQVGNTHGYSFQDDSGTAYLINKEPEVIKDRVDAMIQQGAHMSATLAAKEVNFYPDVDPNASTMTIDTTGYPDGVTIYIDADRIPSNIIGGTEALTINKKDNQVIVFNFNTSKPVTIGKYKVTYNGAVYDTHSPVDPHGDPHNSAMDQVARHIVWNLPNSKDVTLKITTGIFLVPDKKATVSVDGTSSGWVITGGTFTHKSGEFHFVYQDMPAVMK